MDLLGMLNQSDGPTELKHEAALSFRRLSSGSIHSPATVQPSPAADRASLPFAQPSTPASSLKRREASESAEKAVQETPGSLKRRGSDEDAGDAKRISVARGASESRERMSENRKGSAAPEEERQSGRSSIGETPKPKYEPSYMGIRVPSDMHMKLCQFVRHHLLGDGPYAGQEGLEIEAKLGQLVWKESGGRMDFPLITAAMLTPGDPAKLPFRFVADMSKRQHKAFNEHLNAQVQDRARPGRIQYKHTKATDRTYGAPTHGSAVGRGRNVRVTTDDKTGAVLETISKETLDSLNIYCPDAPFDIRISVNMEHRHPLPANYQKGDAAIHGERRKDRLTYTHQHYQVDLTQVMAAGSGAMQGRPMQTTHELEVEVSNMDELRRQARNEADQMPNHFEAMVDSFLGSVIQLTRVARDFS